MKTTKIPQKKVIKLYRFENRQNPTNFLEGSTQSDTTTTCTTILTGTHIFGK